MGGIKDDVQNLHLRLFSDERALLKPFLFNFDVNFAKRVDAQNAQVSAFIISPDRTMREGFAFTEELLLIISSYRRVQPRTMQAVEHIMNMNPFKGRVDPLTYFIVSHDPDIESWTSNYLSNHPQARTPIPLSMAQLAAYKDDRWFARNQLSSRLYRRDLFDYQLPLDGDLFFFGRKRLVDEFLDAVRKGQNQGVFGLRKTGKTSLLFKIERACDELNIATSIYIDCKRPDIRSLSWTALINLIATRISKKISKNFASIKDPVKNLIKLLQSIPENKKVCIIFDEIEYISPIAILDQHWKSEFVPFWQTLWSVQSEVRKLSFIIAGVNPFVCEMDLIDRVQNPMFGIVRPHYLTGLSFEDLQQMIKAIGGRMGLAFNEKAMRYLHKRYGGHPLLTRMACSYSNKSVEQDEINRPFALTDNALISEESDRENELYFYCRHVVSELQEFYRDEYEMLELLASGNVVDFNELASDPAWTGHLKSYGIIEIDPSGRPSFLIPVIQKFVAAEKARRLKTRNVRDIIAVENRNRWLERRKSNIIHDTKLLLRTIEKKGQWQPYGSSFLPEADLLQKMEVCQNWESFGSWVTDLNKSLNESIDISHGKPAFFGRLKETYPYLFDALHRIRLLRNNADHLRLNVGVEDALRNLLKEDLFGRSITQIDDPWFQLQQISCDELFSAVQYELSRIT